MNKVRVIHASVLMCFLIVAPAWVCASALRFLDCDYLVDPSQRRIKINIKQNEVFQATNTLKLGFNQELGRTGGANGDFSNAAVSDLVKMLRPDALRYPGGTTANYFNWKNEKLDESAIDDYANNHIKKLLKKIKKENKGVIPAVPVLSFFNLIEQY